MVWLAGHILTIAILLPLAGAFIVGFLGPARTPQIRWVALVSSLLTFLVSAILYAGLRADTPGMRFIEIHPWITRRRLTITWAWMASACCSSC